MISYDLARQLEAVGFPETGQGKRIGPPDKLSWRGRDRVYVPTLEELIEACGGELESIAQEHSRAGNEWVAISFHGNTGLRGKTPNEAVARLWLDLYSKVKSAA